MADKENANMSTEDYLKRILISQKKIERINRMRLLVQITTSAITLALVVFIAVRVVPQVAPMVSKIDASIALVNELADNTNTLVKQLNAADLSGTVNEARGAIATASVSMEKTAASIQKVDFEALNASIEALREVVNGLESVFGR